MGYGELEQFFHNFESVISLAIEKKVLITTDFMNLLYKSIDLIEQALNILKNEQPIGSLFDTFIREMNGFRPVDLEASGDTNKKERLKEFFKEYGLEDFAQGNITYLDPSKKFYFITITIEKNIRLKIARLFVIIRIFGGLGVIGKTTPPLNDLLEGKVEDQFTVVFQSDQSSGIIHKAINASGEIESIKFEEIFPEQAKKMILSEDIEKETKRTSAATENLAQTSGVKIELTIRNQLLELFGELLIRSKQLDRKIEGLDRQDMKELLFQMQSYMFTLQDVVLKMQLVPLDTIFRVYPRMVRTLADKEGKRIQFVINHHDVKLDRKILNEVGDILTHILRNAVYHGIENEEGTETDAEAH